MKTIIPGTNQTYLCHQNLSIKTWKIHLLWDQPIAVCKQAGWKQVWPQVWEKRIGAQPRGKGVCWGQGGNHTRNNSQGFNHKSNLLQGMWSLYLLKFSCYYLMCPLHNGHYLCEINMNFSGYYLICPYGHPIKGFFRSAWAPFLPSSIYLSITDFFTDTVLASWGINPPGCWVSGSQTSRMLSTASTRVLPARLVFTYLPLSTSWSPLWEQGQEAHALARFSSLKRNNNPTWIRLRNPVLDQRRPLLICSSVVNCLCMSEQVTNIACWFVANGMSHKKEQPYLYYFPFTPGLLGAQIFGHFPHCKHPPSLRGSCSHAVNRGVR